jgi:hypothetical protein
VSQSDRKRSCNPRSRTFSDSKFISSEFPMLDVQILNVRDFGRISKPTPEFVLNCNGKRLKVRKTRLMKKSQFFLRNPAPLSEPEYYVRSIIDPPIFTDFVKSV